MALDDVSTRFPTVSVVTPSLNQGRFIEDALKSVLSQDYPCIEHIVADGGSTDDTLRILHAYTGRVRWISERDAGQAAAINKGFRISSGEILAWLNSDDLYEPGAVSAAVRHMSENPTLMLVYGDATLTDAAGHELGPCAHVEPFDLDRLVHDLDFIVQPAAFFRREAFEAAGGLDESLHWTMDYDLWLKIARRFPVGYLPRKLARYRWTGENKTGLGGFERFDEIERVGLRHGAGGLPAEFRIEKLGLSVREARQRARTVGLGAAVRLLASGVRTVLSSRRAVRRLASLLIPGRRSRYAERS